MKALGKYEIQFSGLKHGKHEFQWELDSNFFGRENHEVFGGHELTATVTMDKTERTLTLVIDIAGRIHTACDHCGEELWLPVKGTGELIARFGSETDLSNDEVIVLGPGEFKIDINRQIYETVILSLPARRIHPPGGCNPEAERFFVIAADSKEEKKENDSRWNALETLKKLK